MVLEVVGMYCVVGSVRVLFEFFYCNKLYEIQFNLDK